MAEPTNDQSRAAAARQPIDWRRVHLWQLQPVRDGLVVAAIIGVIYLGKLVSIVTVPMLLALLFAYLFEPLIRRVTATRHVSRQGAALAIILLAGVLIIVPLVLGTAVGVVQGANVIASVAQNSADLIKAVDADLPPEESRAAYHRLDSGFWRWASDQVKQLRHEVKAYRSNRERLRQQTHPIPDPLSPPHAHETGATPPEATPPPETPATSAPAPQEPGAVAVPWADPRADDPKNPVPAVDGQAGGAPPLDADALADFPAWKEQLFNVVDSSMRWMKENSQELAQSLGKRALGSGAQLLQSVMGVLGSVGFLLFGAFITAFFFFFFSTGWGRVLEFWESLIPERRKHRVIDLVQKMDRVIAGFVRGRLTICFILSVYMTGAYLIIGVPSAFLIGPVVGLLFIVPYVHVIGVPIAMLLMFVEPSSAEWQNAWWWIVFAPIGVYMGAQVLDDYVLSPMIQGKNTNMDTPTIVFASLAGGALAGIYGLLIAIPVAACIKILFQEILIPRVREWAHGKKPDILPIEN